MNVKQYWKSIRSLASELDPEAAERDAREEDSEEKVHLIRSTKEIWLVSKAHEGAGTVAGAVVSAHPWNAARLLKEGTHDLATEEQVREHKAELAKRKIEIEREDSDRRGVPTSKLLETLLSRPPQPAPPRGAAKQTE